MSALVIANTQIRSDAAGRFCLNDLHQASGGAKRHQPGDWLRLKQTQELVAEISKSPDGLREFPEAHCTPVHMVNDGFGNGTYAVKELIYAYAMWISATFHLHVIRAYDSFVTSRQAEICKPTLSGQPQHRADLLVSAGRIFNAARRTARTLGMAPSHAIQSALECTLRHTGINWAHEFEFETTFLAAPDPLVQQVEELLRDQHEATLQELSEELIQRNPGQSVSLSRLGHVLRTLGWRKHRERIPGGTNPKTFWRPVLQA